MQVAGVPDAFYGVYGKAGAQAIAVGSSGSIYEYSFASESWTQQISPTTARLNAVFTSYGSNRDYYVAGFNNTILRRPFNSMLWVPLAPPIPVGQIFPTTWYGLWGTANGNMYFVGTRGLIYRYNGATFTKMDVPASMANVTFTSIWGSGSGNIWVAGTGGTILHYDGQTWTQQASGTTQNLYNVWGSSATNVYVAGRNGVLLHSTNGTSWSQVTIPAAYGTQYLWGIWGTAANDIYVSVENGNVLHWNGARWQTHTTQQTSKLYGMWGTASTNMFAVGQNHTLVRGVN